MFVGLQSLCCQFCLGGHAIIRKPNNSWQNVRRIQVTEDQTRAFGMRMAMKAEVSLLHKLGPKV